MKNFLRQLNAFTVLLALLFFFLGWQLGHQEVSLKWDKYIPKISIDNKEPPKDINLDFKLFWETWDVLSREYIDKKALDPQKLYYGAISGMVEAVGDPYTVFLPPEKQKFSKEDLNGSFEGVGIHLGFNEQRRLIVMAPLVGTPAEKAGIKAEDMIVKIGDKDTTDMALPEAVQLIRGPKGTQVSLTVFRQGEEETRQFDLTRDTIVVKSVELSFVKTPSGKDVAVIKLTRFGERTRDEWQAAVSEILAKGPEGLVLDMRNNPGGLLDGAVYISSEFLEGGDVVLYENSKGVKDSYKVNRVGKLTKLPLVVLINKGSASASEIVAGALQDRKRAKLVGEKSFGKGTIQEALELKGDSGLHVTIAKWLTPNGRWVNELKGLDPDIEVKSSTIQEVESGKDVQLDKALETLN